jgi:hypothetical protein
MEEQTFKRNVAYKMRIGDIVSGKVNLDGERFKSLEFQNNQVVRVNVIANVIEKFIQDSEKKFGSLTLDDASGQIKLKVFGDEIEKLSVFNQGDTVLIVGLLRVWNNEIYITPEIIKKKEPAYLLIRKLEVDKERPKISDPKQLSALKDKMMEMIKAAEKDGGINMDTLIMELKEPPEIINQEIKRLLEDGMIYEPRPGKIRYLG